VLRYKKEVLQALKVQWTFEITAQNSSNPWEWRPQH